MKVEEALARGRQKNTSRGSSRPCRDTSGKTPVVGINDRETKPSVTGTHAIGTAGETCSKHDESPRVFRQVPVAALGRRCRGELAPNDSRWSGQGNSIPTSRGNSALRIGHARGRLPLPGHFQNAALSKLRQIRHLLPQLPGIRLLVGVLTYGSSPPRSSFRSIWPPAYRAIGCP